MGTIQSIVAILVSIIGIVLLVHKHMHSSFSVHTERYRFLKELIGDCNTLSKNREFAIQYALQAFCRMPLPASDAIWFVECPGAFQHLKRYGRALRYLNIDKSESCFRYMERYTKRKTIVKEYVQVIVGYVFFGFLGLYLLLKSPYWFKSYGPGVLVMTLPVGIWMLAASIPFILGMIALRDARNLVRVGNVAL